MNQHVQKLVGPNAKRLPSEPNDAGTAGANHRNLGAVAKAEFFDPLHLIRSPDHFGNQSGFTSTKTVQWDKTLHSNQPPP